MWVLCWNYHSWIYKEHGKYCLRKVGYGTLTYNEFQENMNTIRNHDIEMPEKNGKFDEEWLRQAE